MPRAESQEFFVSKFFQDLQKGDVDGFMNRLRSFFAGIPYAGGGQVAARTKISSSANPEGVDELNDQTERHYQTIFYLVFRLMGQYTQAEVHGSQGRADAVVIAGDTVYVFEFKLSRDGAGDAVEEALRQIEEKGYATQYRTSGRNIVAVGAEFDAGTRTLGRWKAVTSSVQ